MWTLPSFTFFLFFGFTVCVFEFVFRFCIICVFQFHSLYIFKFNSHLNSFRFTCYTCSFNRKPIGPGEECRETVTLKARRAGRQEIVANFHCRQICDIASAAELDITDDTKNWDDVMHLAYIYPLAWELVTSSFLLSSCLLLSYSPYLIRHRAYC